jgi:hypothetical protein
METSMSPSHEELLSDVERYSSVLRALLPQLPLAERERLLTRLVEDLKRSTDLALIVLKGAPTSVVNAAAQSGAGRPRSADGTIPGIIRSVLAQNRNGLVTREIIVEVKVIRPNTTDVAISSALHFMRKRGELARDGYHKNYRYVLTHTRPEMINGGGYSETNKND